jgi:hypothetical protein
MPQRMWKHRCPDDRTESWMGTAVCRSCGGRGDYDGWHYTMHEAMARYQSQYRLKPIGPNRGMADTLLRDTTVACEVCRGRGLRDVGGDRWETCQTCRGFGSVFAFSASEIQRRRQRVLDAYPDAEAQAVPDFAGAPLAFNLAAGQVVNLSSQNEAQEQR